MNAHQTKSGRERGERYIESKFSLYYVLMFNLIQAIQTIAIQQIS